jgi:hypothetical protein
MLLYMKLVKLKETDTDIYRDSLDVTDTDILYAYRDLLLKCHALELTSEFTKLRAIDTVTNVFSITLNYTNNLGAAISFGDKACYLYSEFVSQISEAEKLFLRLTSRDASIYVYNKTIFLLNKNNNTQPHSTHSTCVLLKHLIIKSICNKHGNQTFKDVSEPIIHSILSKEMMSLIDNLYYKVDNIEDFYRCLNWILEHPLSLKQKIDYDYTNFSVESFTQ